MKRRFNGVWLGRRGYEPVHSLQEKLLEQRRAGLVGDTVLFVEHDPVVTLGRGAKDEHVLLGEAALNAAGIAFFRTGRGGDVTLHAPGQLVCYPILDLSPDRRDVRKYVRDLTEAMRRLVADYGVGAGTLDRYIGLWVDGASPGVFPGEAAALRPVKLGAIGVRISHWITMHGFALNLSTDLDLFRAIVPCGIRDHAVTSVLDLTGTAPALRDAAEQALAHLCAVFDADSEGISDSRPELWALSA